MAALLLFGWRELDHRTGARRAAQERKAAESSGHKIFLRACQECHTVVGHETQPRGGGGDLSIGSFSVAQEESFAAIMPVHSPLTAAELRDVSVYVIGRQRHFAHAARR